MTTTTAATGTYLAKCAWAGHRFRSESRPANMRDTVCPDCSPVMHFDSGRGYLGYSILKWAAVKATASDRKCSDVCRSAKSALCACECAGDNHGAAYGSVV